MKRQDLLIISSWKGIVMLRKTMVKLSFKIFTNALICSLVAMLAYLTVILLVNQAWLNVLFTCLTALILWAVIYSSCWSEAERDRNRAKFGHMTKYMPKGVVSALFATIPFLIVYILYAFNMWKNSPVAYYIVYLLFNIPYLSFVTAFKHNALALVLLLIPMPVAAQVGYILGYRQFSISDKLIYKNKKKTTKNTRFNR
jgi:CDP-diglyceride synthetase